MFKLRLVLLMLFAGLVPARPNGILPVSGEGNYGTPPAETFLEVLAKPKDDVPVLLKRYGLYDYECNITQFFKINGLKEDYRIKAGKSYKVPVLQVKYNGKSIRSTLGIDDWKTAVRIQDYNNEALKKQLRTDNFVESKELWVPWHELHCKEQVKSTAADSPAAVSTEGEPVTIAGSRVFPVFGKKYAKVPVASSRLTGQVFYIISGHGGPDVGAQGTRAGTTLCEDEYAYDVSLRLARLLIGHGAIVYMIVRDPNDGIRDENYLKCDKDEIVWGNKTIPVDQKARLAQRTDLVNTLYKQHLNAGRKVQTLIEIHVDSRTRNHRTDVFFYYRPDGAVSKALAQQMHRTFLQKYLKVRATQSYNGTVSCRYLYTLKQTTIPRAVYIELANIRNDWDQQRLVVTSNRQALANWMCEALLAK